LLSKVSSGAGKVEESINIGSLVQSWNGSEAEAQVKREPERATDSRNAADDVCAIDGTAVPSVCSSVGGFDKDDVPAAVVGSNGDKEVEEANE
jgi:hypothetical protein